MITTTEKSQRDMLSDTDLRARLHSGALAVADGDTEADAWMDAMVLAHGSLCATGVVRACRAYAKAVGVRDDPDSWAFHFSDLEGPGWRDTAQQIADDDVAETMGVLINGRPC